MPVVLIVVAAAIVVGVIIVALGRGGELAKSTADFVPFESDDDITATDVALLRPPPSLYGYHIPATDQALSQIAQAMTERDVEIATLRRQLADLRSVTDADVRPDAQAPTDYGVLGMTGIPGEPGVPGSAGGSAGTGFAGSPGDPGEAGLPGEPGVPGSPGSSAETGFSGMAWPPQTPWSAWERQSGPAAGPAGPAQRAAWDPAVDTDPGASGDAW